MDFNCQIILIEKSKEYYYLIDRYIKEINQTTSVNYQLSWKNNLECQFREERKSRPTQPACIYIIDFWFLVTSCNPNLQKYSSSAIVDGDLKKAIAQVKNSILRSQSDSVIILTDDYETGIKTLEAGATDYLSKEELTLSSLERCLRLNFANSYLKQENKQQKPTKIELQCRELARSNAELEQFAYVASHDLQAPLNTITNYAQLLELRYQEKLDDRGYKCINYIVDSAKKMKTQIEDLLEYSRLGRQKSTWRETDLYLVLQQAVSNLQSTIDSEQVKIICDRDFPTLVVDSSQLVVLWQNLLENSIKYRRQEPLVIQIKVEEQENYWHFSVSDNGIGFEPEYKQRIFQIFQRLYTQDEYPGNGIGLAICQKIVEQHGGNIWVESQINKGSTFYFTIPKQSHS